MDFPLGHQNAPQYDDIMTLGSELRALHVHDNRENLDEHAPIDSNYQGCFTLESSCPFGCEKILARNKRQFPGDTRLYRPTKH